MQEISLEEALFTYRGGNSIASLTFHVNYYLDGLNDVFNGKPLSIRDKFSWNVPLVTTIEEWKHLSQRLHDNALDFIQHVEYMSDEVLDGPFVDERYGTVERNIEAVLEHSYYHLGQISLLWKIARGGSE